MNATQTKTPTMPNSIPEIDVDPNDTGFEKNPESSLPNGRLGPPTS